MLRDSALIVGTGCFGKADEDGAQLFSATEQGISIEPELCWPEPSVFLLLRWRRSCGLDERPL